MHSRQMYAGSNCVQVVGSYLVCPILCLAADEADYNSPQNCDDGIDQSIKLEDNRIYER